MNRVLDGVMCLLMIPCILFASYTDDDKVRMVADLDIIKNEIEINYAPLEWKRLSINWNLNQEIEKAREKILKTEILTSRKYQKVIHDLFNSLQDLHVGVNFYSTEYAVLPFLVQGADSRYFVVWVDDQWTALKGIPLQIGDEILLFDSRPIADIIQEIHHSTYGLNDKETFRHLSELHLTVREGSASTYVPQGPVEIVYKSYRKADPDTFVTEWQYLPEEISNDFAIPLKPSLLGKHPFFYKSRLLPLYARLKSFKTRYEGILLGAKKSLFPPLGPIKWKSNSTYFDAYIYLLKGKNIGYVRIPTFHAEMEEAEEFRKIIAAMESRTQALIIDVMNNPGGYAFHAYALASMLTDKPLLNLKEQMTITQEDVYFALKEAEILSYVDTNEDAVEILGHDICGYPVDKELAAAILKNTRFIREQYKLGKFFTDPYPVEGLEFIRPHSKTRYTKPILILTNSLSVSCGDLLPALLKDNERAKTLGFQTAGAGGYMLVKNYSNRFGLAHFTLTGSLIYRLNGEPIENQGIQPDYPYSFNCRDYTKDYIDFINYINSLIIDNF